MDVKATIASGENLRVEFKSSFNAEAIETLVAFANSKGGTVFIGITDNTEIKGVVLQAETIQQWINEIKTKTTPQIIPETKIVQQDGKTIVLLTTNEYPVKPVALKGRFYKRVANSNQVLSAAEVVNMHL